MSAIFPALRVAHCEHHYVFCLLRANEAALIVAIFHERMDLMARLADRLDKAGWVRGGQPRWLPVGRSDSASLISLPIQLRT